MRGQVGQLKAAACSKQPLIARPELGAGRKSGRSQEACINVADAEAEERVRFNEVQNLIIRRDLRLWQLAHCIQDGTAVVQVAEGEFSHDRRVRAYPAVVE